MQHRHRTKRVPAILEGRIRFDGWQSYETCTIRDLSVTGARIWLPGYFEPLGEFELEIPKLERSLRARLVWSRAQTHGVQFLEPLEHSAGDDVTSLLAALEYSTAQTSYPDMESPAKTLSGSYPEPFSATDAAVEVGDDPIEPQEANPTNDALAHALRWAGLIFAIGLLAAAVVIAVG
jgi:hypothetical protein